MFEKFVLSTCGRVSGKIKGLVIPLKIEIAVEFINKLIY
jgi:hypothetical protein